MFGKECKSCQTTFKLHLLLHMEQKCLESKAHSREQHFHLTLTTPSSRDSTPIPVHHRAREMATHSASVFASGRADK